MRVSCTLGGNRTLTPLPELDFESSASTNSATKAWFRDCKYNLFYKTKTYFFIKS